MTRRNLLCETQGKNPKLTADKPVRKFGFDSLEEKPTTVI
jgi:hypothetical protein